MFKTKFTIFLLSLTLILVACSPQGYTKEDEESVVKRLTALTTNGIKPIDFEKELNEEIEKLSEEGSAKAIDSLLHLMFSGLARLNDKVGGFQDDLDGWVKSGNDVSNKEHRNAIEDSLFKAYIDEIYSFRLKIITTDEMYSIQPDFNYILEKYGKYMSEDVRSYMELSREEVENPFFDVESKKIDLAIVSDRIVKIMELRNKFVDSPYMETLTMSEEYYRQVYFGMNNPYLFDGDRIVADEVVEQYKKDVEKYRSTKFGDEVSHLLDILKESENKIDANALAYITDIIVLVKPEDLKENEEDVYHEEEGVSHEEGELNNEEE